MKRKIIFVAITIFVIVWLLMTSATGIFTPGTRMYPIDDYSVRGILKDNNELDNEEIVSMLVFLTDRVDITTLDSEMNQQKITLQERHKTVVVSLQQKAEATQGDFIAYLTERQSEGRVVDFKPYWISNLIRVDAPISEFQNIRKRDDVLEIYYNYEIELIEPVRNQPDTQTINRGDPENGVQAVRAPEVWDLGYTGEGVLVATIDTGVDGNHPALAYRWAGVADPNYAGHPEWAWLDAYSGQNSFPFDYNGHGTHTMGTVCGGAPGDQIGVAPGAYWIAARAIDCGGGIAQTVADAIESFEWMIDPDGDPGTNWDVPAVCSNSWGLITAHGYPPCDETFWSYLDACEAAGIVILFSAGNEGYSGLRRPADRATDDYRTCAVAAVDAHNPSWPIADFSSRGPTYCTPGGDPAIKPDIAAPGVDVRSAWPGGGYYDIDGTSMASPHVNGVVALMRQANPDISVQDIKQIIYETAYDLGPTGEDNSYGWGMIDAYEAVQRVLDFITPDLECEGELSWVDIEPGVVVEGSFTVENIGDLGSLLDWAVESYPEWGNWTFNPENGTGLEEGDTVTIDVEVIVPDEPEETFSGEIKIINSENSSDFCIIDVSLATPVSQFQSNQQIPSFLQSIIERYPILRQVLGL